MEIKIDGILKQKLVDEFGHDFLWQLEHIIDTAMFLKNGTNKGFRKLRNVRFSGNTPFHVYYTNSNNEKRQIKINEK
jgi:hypothetical protein